MSELKRGKVIHIGLGVLTVVSSSLYRQCVECFRVIFNLMETRPRCSSESGKKRMVSKQPPG